MELAIAEQPRQWLVFLTNFDWSPWVLGPHELGVRGYTVMMRGLSGLRRFSRWIGSEPVGERLRGCWHLICR